MLETIDLTKQIERDEYRERLLEFQVRLRQLAHELYAQTRSLVIVFEGWDAAGKGGSIRRLTEKTDPRGYQVYPIAAPEGEDRTHHYLWRFWRRLKFPEDKQIVIFDRSWYGRVLVERVEGFADEREWKRAYREINDFERQLRRAGVMLVKFWFQISPEEQLRRFEARNETLHKTWKLTDEDWRNRQKWPEYLEAVEEMLAKTSTLHAPWTVVEAEQKWYARIKVLRTVTDVLAAELAPDRQASGAKSRKRKKNDKKKG